MSVAALPFVMPIWYSSVSLLSPPVEPPKVPPWVTLRTSFSVLSTGSTMVALAADAVPV